MVGTDRDVVEFVAGGKANVYFTVKSSATSTVTLGFTAAGSITSDNPVTVTAGVPFTVTCTGGDWSQGHATLSNSKFTIVDEGTSYAADGATIVIVADGTISTTESLSIGYMDN